MYYPDDMHLYDNDPRSPDYCTNKQRRAVMVDDDDFLEDADNVGAEEQEPDQS